MVINNRLKKGAKSEKALSQNDKEKSIHLKLTRGPFNMNEEGITSPGNLLALLVQGDNGEGDSLI